MSCSISLCSLAHLNVSLPQLYKAQVDSINVKDDTTCTITLSDAKDLDDITILACNHLFDTKSIEEWISRTSNCPNCKVTDVTRKRYWSEDKVINEYDSGLAKVAPAPEHKRFVAFSGKLIEPYSSIVKSIPFKVTAISFNLLHRAVVIAYSLFSLSLILSYAVACIACKIFGSLSGFVIKSVAIIVLNVMRVANKFLFPLNYDPQPYQEKLELIEYGVILYSDFWSTPMFQTQNLANLLTKALNIFKPQHSPRSIWNDSLLYRPIPFPVATP